MPPKKRHNASAKPESPAADDEPKAKVQRPSRTCTSTNNAGASLLSDMGLEWVHSDQMITDDIPYLLALMPTSKDGPLKPSQKLAAFDLDDTLVNRKSGRKWPTGPTDWVWLYDCIPDKLRQLYKDGYRLVIISNQKGIEKKTTKASDMMKKMELMFTDLGVPMLATFACGENQYRKPSTAVWDFLVKNGNQGVEFDKAQSFYVGDAAGRADNYVPGRKKDFACTDRKFAKNLNLPFHTPEEFFLGEAVAPFKWGGTDPNAILDAKPSTATLAKSYHSEKQELVLMVGPPASGKSSFVKRFFTPHGYEWVNRDTLKTPEKCLKAAQNALEAGKSVVVDNTNGAPHQRAEYVQLAKAKKIPVRCIVMETPLEVAHHLNFYRQAQTRGEVRRIPDVGYNVYKKNFQEPDAGKEGFTEVLRIPFVPNFTNKAEETLFRQWQE